MSLVETKRYLDRAQALVGQSLLAARGIDSRVAADDEGGMAPHMSYVTGVRLLVAAHERDRALAILDEAETAAQAGEDAIGDAWRTGEGAQEVGHLRQLAGGRAEGDESPPRKVDARLIRGGASGDDEQPSGSLLFDRTRDPGVLAYRAAILGFLLLPVALHLYSSFHVVRAMRAWGDLPQRSRRLAVVAGVIDLAVVGCAIYLVPAWLQRDS